jgi:hypothetical protein
MVMALFKSSGVKGVSRSSVLRAALSRWVGDEREVAGQSYVRQIFDFLLLLLLLLIR